MARPFLLPLIAVAALAPFAALAESPDEALARDDRIAALERQVQTLTEELGKLRTEATVPEDLPLASKHGHGPAASKIYGAGRGVSIGVRIDDVGLSAMRQMMSCPVDIPPAVPPAWLVSNVGGFPMSEPGRMTSAFSSPRRRAAAKPSPISTPFTAFTDIIAAAISPSSLA